LAPVSGTVLVDDVPIEKAQLLFMPVSGGRPAAGVTDASGKFRLTTFEEHDGAIVGEHKVTVTFRRPIRVDAEPEAKPGQPLPKTYPDNWRSPVPEKYSSPATSGLVATVKPDEFNDITLNLTARP
jgi:hypothetical protein